MKTEAELRQEFDLLNKIKPGNKPLDFFQLCSIYPSATNVRNFQRNRYKDVLPEERTRVKLQCTDDSDYINANFVHNSKYISCQAPLPHTTLHFWRMIWEQKTPVIVMLTRTIEGDRKKADVYWPDIPSETLEFGQISANLKSVTKLTFITIRIIELCFNNERREIVHLHYTEWPDFGVPQSTHKIRELIWLMNLYRERAQSQGLNGPIATHCSAGIGRCGTYLAILIALERIMEEGLDYNELDLVDIVAQMRSDRCGMVQTDSQYIFIHRVLDDILKERQHKKLGSSSLGKRLSYSLDILPSEDRSFHDFASSSEDEEYEESSASSPELPRCSFSFGNDISKRLSSSSIECKQ